MFRISKFTKKDEWLPMADRRENWGMTANGMGSLDDDNDSCATL